MKDRSYEPLEKTETIAKYHFTMNNTITFNDSYWTLSKSEGLHVSRNINPQSTMHEKQAPEGSLKWMPGLGNQNQIYILYCEP